MYKLRATEDLLTTQFYYDQNVGRCRGLDLQNHLDQVVSPSIVKELQPRDLEKRGRFNLVLHDGSKVFDVDPSRLIVVDYDALKEVKDLKGRIMPKAQSLADLKRIAIAKHGEDRAWSLAMLNGNPNHKKPWQLAIAHPVQTVEEKLDHQIWQEKINGKNND